MAGYIMDGDWMSSIDTKLGDGVRQCTHTAFFFHLENKCITSLSPL